MPTVLERLRAALRPEYEVKRELASGGMGTVFLARDVNLDRPVAIKIIRPELATARATERFLHEARILANLSHPNVVPVHRAGEAGGFSYYVMDHVQGDTLSERLEQGPLSPDEVLKLGRDQLDALEAVHRLGVVHRDIKPSNIFLIGGRTLLADFGIAKPSEPSETTEGVTGTPGYMPPEQAFGLDVSPQTDLYALAMVLYESFTGRRWQALLQSGEKDHDWRGVPRPVVSILRRGLAWEPADRWADAAAFRHALWRTRTRKYRWRTAILTASALIVGGTLARSLLVPEPLPPADLAILPFTVEGDLDSRWSTDLAVLTHASIGVMDLIPMNTVIRAYNAAGADPARLFELLDARAYVRGTVTTEGDEWLVQLQVVELDGTELEAAPVAAKETEINDLGCRLGSEIVRLAAPQHLDQFTCSLALVGTKAEAVTEWLEGERAFARQVWDTAEGHFARALSLDPNFALAKWRLVNARRWLRVPYGVDLVQLYREQRNQLGEVDRMLLDAWLTPVGRERFEKYRVAIEKYHRDPYAWLLYGDDLLNRGALVGIPLDSAATVLARAVEKDSLSGPAYQQLAWALIHLGRREEARYAVDRLRETAGPGAVIPPQLFRLAYLERFAPDTALAARAELIGGAEWSEAADALSSVGLRWAPSFDLASTQAEIAASLMTLPRAPHEHRANAHEARGLALVALGRLSEALVHFDSAAIMYGAAEARLQAAQWRILPGAFGMGGVEATEQVRGRRALERFTQSPELGTRAAWTLALDADARGDTAAAGKWWRRVRAASGPGSEDLHLFLQAVDLARRAQFSQALAVSQPLVPYAVPRTSDPFLRTGIYLKRAEWWSHLGDPRAYRALLWYQNIDLIGWPSGVAQAGEIDWAFGTYGRFRRGSAAMERGDARAACEWLQRVASLWSNADSALEPLVQETSRLRSRSCRR